MPERVTVRVPATSANLGCAFDCAALALALYLDVHVTCRHDSAINVQYSGVTPERIPSDGTNLIARTMQQTLRELNHERGFDLEIENQIPVGVGLGSSAAAIVAAAVAAYWMAERPLYDEELISLATRLEGHPDNVAAAWLGGFTVALQDGDRVHAYSSPVPELAHLALITPAYAMPTEKARGALPTEYSRADVVHNLQRAAVLAAQFFCGKTDLHRCLFDDRLHQTYRAPLMPGLREALELHHPDLLGVCLSGAGPSILAFTRGSGASAAEGICAILREKGVESEYSLIFPDNRGAKGWSLPV